MNCNKANWKAVAALLVITMVAGSLAACTPAAAPVPPTAAPAAPAAPTAAPASPTQALQAEAKPTEAAQAAASGDFYDNVKLVAKGPMVDASKYKKPGPYRIGVSNGFSGNSWRKMMIETIKEEAAKQKDIKDLIILDGQGDDTKQINDIESLISQEVDAIIVDPNSGTALAPVLKKAYDKGIVVNVIDIPVDGEDYTAYMATAPEPAAERFAKFLAEKVGKGGKIVALGGIPGNTYTAAGWGVTEPILKDAGVEVLAFKDANWEEDKAKVIMTDLIAAYPQIDGVWCDGMQVCTGATKALQAAKRPLVPVTGDDYNGILRIYDENKDKEKKFDFLSISTATWQGALALHKALDMLREGKGVPKQQIIDVQPVTKDNYQQFYKKGMPDAVAFDTPLSDAKLKEIFSSQ